jgi:hypothetical protein
MTAEKTPQEPNLRYRRLFETAQDGILKQEKYKM